MVGQGLKIFPEKKVSTVIILKMHQFKQKKNLEKITNDCEEQLKAKTVSRQGDANRSKSQYHKPIYIGAFSLSSVLMSNMQASLLIVSL